MIKKLIALVIATAMIFTAIGAFALTLPPEEPPPESFWSADRPEITGDEVLVYVNGLYLHTLEGGAAPFIENERTMVPLRALAEAFEFDVDWEEYENEYGFFQRITLTRENKRIVMFVGRSEIIVYDMPREPELLNFYNAVPMIRNDRTFLPVRRLADVLDVEVDWCDGTRTATFTRRIEEVVSGGGNVFGGAAHTPNATLTQDGLTVTVLQTIADTNSVYVVYEIIAECGYEFGDGVSIIATLNPENVRESGRWSSGSSSIILEREGNRLTVLQNFSGAFSEGNVRFSIFTIGYLAEDRSDFTVLFGEHGVSVYTVPWALEWELVFEDTGITLEPNLLITLGDRETTLTKLSVSPISATLVFVGDDIRSTPPSFVEILLADGSRVTFNTDSDNAMFGGVSSFGDMDIEEIIRLREMMMAGYNVPQIFEKTLFYRFDYIINVNDIISINIGNVTIPFN